MRKVDEYLIEKGIKVSYKGFEVLSKAIELCQADKKYMRGFNVLLYPKLSEIFGESGTRIERNIRHCLTTQPKKITNKEFIARAVLDMRGE